MKIVLLFIIMIIFPHHVFSQDVKGVVKYDEKGQNHFGVHDIKVKNKQTKHLTRTDIKGRFSIAADVGDTIYFSSPNINNRYAIISSKHLEKDLNEFFLEPNVINLKEVKIHNLDKNIANNIPKENNDKIKDLYLNLGIDPNLRDLKPQQDFSKLKIGDFANPIRIIDHLSGRMKKQRSIQKYEKEQDKLAEIKSFFDKNYFVDKLLIPESKVDEFIRYAQSKHNLISVYNNSSFEIVENLFLNASYEYLKILNSNETK